MNQTATETIPETFDLVYLDPKTIQIGHDGMNLTLTDSNGHFFPRVSLRRCYPLSAGDTFILVRLPDSEQEHGGEIGTIKDIQELSSESRQAVRQELKLHYLVPVVKCIRSIREEFGFLYWSADTDRGAKDFILRDSILSSTRRMSPTHWLLIDINQTRYEIRDLEALDKDSQELVRKYLLL